MAYIRGQYYIKNSSKGELVAVAMREKGKIALDMSQTIRSGFDAVTSIACRWGELGSFACFGACFWCIDNHRIYG
jgi:hypothetical protein